jgi:hypothetical protein
MPNCRKGRTQPIPFNCKQESGHAGECSPYTLPPQGNWLDWLSLPVKRGSVPTPRRGDR